MPENRTSVVLTSHFMDEVEQLCGRAVILSDGRKVAEGTVGGIVVSVRTFRWDME
ncbi:MAG: hypothetical protein ACOC7V_11780 [Spirochaetota bacterium]